MQKFVYKSQRNKFELCDGFAAHKEAQLPGGWQVRCDTEPYHKKERPVLLTLQKGAGPLAYKPRFTVLCENGKVHLGFQECWPARAAAWAAAVLALALMLASALLPAPWNRALYAVLGAAALAILFVDFTRANRAVKRIGQYLKENVL